MGLLPDEADLDGNFYGDRKFGKNVPVKAAREGQSRQAADPWLIPSAQASTGFGRGVPPQLENLTRFFPHLALATCLFGFAWAAGSYFGGDQSPHFSGKNPPSSPSAMQQDRMERAQLARSVQKMAGDIHALQVSMENLRAEQSQAAKNSSSFEGLTARLDAVRSENNAAILAMAGKVERAQREPDAKLSQVIDRLDRLERKLAAAGTAAGVTPVPAGATQTRAPVAADPANIPLDNASESKRPHLITNWVVRDVYDGMALLQGAHGTIEVAPGEIVPGAGRVKAIERRGPGWIVITSRGLVDSAHNVFVP
jgi:hypothetical protein